MFNFLPVFYLITHIATLGLSTSEKETVDKNTIHENIRLKMTFLSS